jgi:nicotinate-nucleotide pyrophosphorylase (carboxylating)
VSLKIPAFQAQLKAALAEDGARRDVTTLATVPASARSRARLVAREAGVAAGLPLFAAAFRVLDPRCRVRLRLKDGRAFKAGAVLAELSGPSRALLSAERVALNFVQRLSGTATLTAAFVARARGTRAAILDTRKTTPVLRALEKYAVLCGGGENHRFNLSDAILIKDNHLTLCGGSAAEAVRRARKAFPGRGIEVEVDRLDQLKDALLAGPDIVLLDNMAPARLRPALRLLAKARSRRGKRVLSEISGGVTLKSVGRLARLGVDRISVGALTHSARALDLSLEFE